MCVCACVCERERETEMHTNIHISDAYKHSYTTTTQLDSREGGVRACDTWEWLAQKDAMMEGQTLSLDQLCVAATGLPISSLYEHAAHFALTQGRPYRAAELFHLAAVSPLCAVDALLHGKHPCAAAGYLGKWLSRRRVGSVRQWKMVQNLCGHDASGPRQSVGTVYGTSAESSGSVMSVSEWAQRDRVAASDNAVKVDAEKAVLSASEGTQHDGSLGSDSAVKAEAEKVVELGNAGRGDSESWQVGEWVNGLRRTYDDARLLMLLLDLGRCE